MSLDEGQYLNVAKIGNDLCIRGIENGKRYFERVEYQPYLYLETRDETEFKSMFGLNLKRKNFDKIGDLWAFKKACKEQDIKLYGMDNPVCAFMNDTYTNEFDPNCQRIFYLDIENKIRDEDGINHGIDTEGAFGELTAITIYDTLEETYYIFGTKVWENTKYDHKIKYFHCESEGHLIREFIKLWTSAYPDIVTGWNSTGYDIPYLINRITKVCGKPMANKLSPWGKITTRQFKNDFQKMQTEYTIVGISSLDYLQIYKKNTFHNQESYKLDFIAHVELGKGKVNYKDEGYKDLDDLYERNPQMYIDYNIRDVESLIEIDAKNKFMDIVVGIAHYSLVNYDEVYSVLRCWDSIRHRYLKSIGVVSSPKSTNIKTDKFTGAYVKEPRPNLYRWVMTFDLRSLYPDIIQTINIGDEMLLPPHLIPAELMELYDRDLSMMILNDELTEVHVKALQDNNLTLAANGTFYRNTEQSVQSILAKNILERRAVFKQAMIQYQKEYEAALAAGASKEELKRLSDLVTMNKNNQMVVKVLANSLYGAMGNQYDRYFDLFLAEGVTLTGQTIIKWAEKKVNDYLNTVLRTKRVGYCIYSDTDSIFINLEPLVKAMNLDESDENSVVDFMDKAGDKFNDVLADAFSELTYLLNSQNNRLYMKREVISSAALFRSKKNYAMKVWDNEGVRYEEPHYKIMGIETQRSTSPAFVRAHLEHIIQRVLSNCKHGEVLDYVENVRQAYFKETDYEKTFFPKGTKDLEKYYDEDEIYKFKTPIHVRGSLLFNRHFASPEQIIESGDSVRFTYLRLPNPIRENTIAITEDFPPDLVKYIDNKTNFYKIFEKPVLSLIDLMGWNLHNNVNMRDLL